MSSNAIYAFLDSNYATPQHIQMLFFSTYALKNNVQISFYGAELCGTEYSHFLFKDYIRNRKETQYLFFTIRQFISIEGILDSSILMLALSKGIELHFANENLRISNSKDLFKVKCLLLSTEIENYLLTSN